MAAQGSQLENYLGSFTEHAKDVARETPPWLRELRESAFARFCAVGFPTTRDEEWRFTNVAGVTRIPFQLPQETKVPLALSELMRWRMFDSAARIVFVNGRFTPRLSTCGRLPDRVIVNSLHSEIVNRPEALADHMGHYLDIERDPFCALNTAFAEDGAFIYVNRRTVLQQPIHLLFISSPSGMPIMTHPRNLIVIEDEGQASIVEEFVSCGTDTPVFVNAATELVVGGNAVVAHTMIEREHLQTYKLSTLRIEQARSANVASHSLLLGGGLVRNNVHPVLAGEGGECVINGLFIGSKRQHLDNYMLVEHCSPHCTSRQFYNGILEGQAHGVFHGRIIVHKEAQKTDAKQTNRTLLLSDDAQINTKPQLEIYADDVKCTHGATIGQIEEDALFYLRSRGIREGEARRLLLEAFAGECLDRMKRDTLHDYAETAVRARLQLVDESMPPERGSSGEEQGRDWQEAG